MKFPLTIFLACTALCASRAQTIEAHEVGTGSGRVTHWETSWGSYNRDYHQAKKIRITLRDVTRRLQNAEVCIYFVGRKQPRRDLFIYNYAFLKADLHGEMEASDEIAAPPLFLNKQHYAALKEDYSSGSEMEGWIVIGRVGSRVFGEASSNRNLLEASRNGSLDKLIAEARIHEKKPVENATPQKNGAKVATPPPPSTPEASAAPAAQFVTLTAPIEVAIQYGKTLLPRGTRLKLISRDGAKINVTYLDQSVVIPISATDLK
jgi:hypothetical protein